MASVYLKLIVAHPPHVDPELIQQIKVVNVMIFQKYMTKQHLHVTKLHLEHVPQDSLVVFQAVKNVHELLIHYNCCYVMFVLEMNYRIVNNVLKITIWTKMLEHVNNAQ